MNYSWSNDDGASRFTIVGDNLEFEIDLSEHGWMYVHMTGNTKQWNEVKNSLFDNTSEKFLEDLIKFATMALADIRNPNK